MRTSRSIAIAPLAALFLTLAGCGAGEGPDTEPTSNSTGTSAESSPSPTGPTVPEDWEAASVEIAQLHVPSDWTIKSGGKQLLTLRAPKNEVGLSPGAGHISVGVYSTDGEIKAELDELAELHATQLERDASFTKIERQPNETINGSLFYHFRVETEYTWEEMYGTLVPDAGRQVAVEWSFNKSDIDRKGAEALIAPIMATYEVL